MSARTKARKRALDVLFAAEARGLPIGDVLAEYLGRGEPPVPEYAQQLVVGVGEHLRTIDDLIEGYARDWSLKRMPAVDRNVLRLATYEVLHEPDVPGSVVISEAVHLARLLSTDESPGFVNGIMARVVAENRQ